MSRADKYEERYAEEARKLRLAGFTYDQLAAFYNVKPARITTWRRRYPDFADACREGGELADAVVAHSLYQRAVGYNHPEHKVISYLGEASTIEVNKHCPPDVAAAIFWLRTRDPSRWRDPDATAAEVPTVNITFTDIKEVEATKDMPEDDL